MRVGPSAFVVVLGLAFSAAPPVRGYNYTLLKEMAGTNSKLTNAMGTCGAMAIGWVRTVFHDFATFDANATSAEHRGGLDASILTETEANIDDNGDIRGGGNIQFFRTWALQHPSVSATDWIVLGGMVALRICGGPDLTPQFRPGRVDSFKANNIELLPNKDMSLDAIHTAFKRMNFTQPEYLTLVLGSHSLGGVNMTSGSPGFGKYPPHSFDSTPSVFDNNYFVNAIASKTDSKVLSPYWLPSDDKIGSEPGAAALIQSYAGTTSSVAAANTLFKDRYGTVFMKMVDMGHTLGCPLSGAGCTAAQLVDSNIANSISAIPESWIPAGYQSVPSPAGGPIIQLTGTASADKTGAASHVAEPTIAVRTLLSAFFVCLGSVWFA
ncbi:heme peroxidase [Cladochytrium replicatum]|nr:heme peroxidase [Cladochytrium replicatum]